MAQEGAVLDEFERLDTNGDGELSFLELAAALANDAGSLPEIFATHFHTYSQTQNALWWCRGDRRRRYNHGIRGAVWWRAIGAAHDIAGAISCQPQQLAQCDDTWLGAAAAS